MAIIGGAVLTPVMGLIAEATHGTATAYLVPLAGYMCVAAYALFGTTWGLGNESRS
jgi:FHS family L-fucose permease-like MFS transporter